MEFIRCECGKLLCKVVERKILIKCRHCKRVAQLRFIPRDQSSKKEISQS